MALDLDRLIGTAARRIIAATEELTALDGATGDGDHGLNMKRGMEAVLAEKAAIAAQPLPGALKAIGTALVMNIGGASGPLYGTLFLTLGKELPAEPTIADAARALRAAVAAVMARGKSAFGDKTMLDVLGPLADHLAESGVTFDSVRELASARAKATAGMRAIRGRASFLGERSIGHMDSGARSSEIIIHAVCDALEGRT